jgi:hypothetical protein
MKNLMTMDRLDAETALELPNREMLLVTIVIGNLLSGNDVEVNVVNNKVAVQVCAIVELIDSDLLGGNTLDCDIRQ